MRQRDLSFPHPRRFLLVSKPDAVGSVLAIVQRVIASWLADQAGVDCSRAQCGAVMLIQRFGSALSLNIHFNMLWMVGVYEKTAEQPHRKPRLHRTRAPTSTQLTRWPARSRIACAGIWRIAASSKARTNPRSCPTALPSTTAWMGCG